VVVRVGVAPSHKLFPLIEQTVGALSSDEALLLRRSAGGFEVLNPRPNGGLRAPRTFTVGSSGGLGASLLNGAKGLIRAIDDRGHPVLAYAVPVPDSPWTLLTKLDASDAYAELNRISSLVLAMLFALSLLALWWWRMHHRYLTSELAHRLHQGLLTRRIDTLSRYANDAILLCDEQGSITDVNERGSAIYGLDRSKLVGKKLADLQAAETRADLPAALAQLKSQGSLVLVTRHQDQKGMVFPVELSARLIEFEGHTRIHATVHDLTERVSAQHHIVHLSRLYATISAVNQAVVRGRTLDDVLRLVCRACVDHGGFGTAKVKLVDPQSGALTARVSCGMHAQVATAFDLPPDANREDASHDPTLAAYQQRRIQVINHIRQMPPSTWRETALRRGDESVVALPLVRAGRTLGTITAYSGDPGTLHEDVIQLLTEMADELSLAVEHFENETRRQEAARRLEEMSRRVVSVQEDERRRLSVELHDRTGANLAAVNLNLAAISRVIRRRNADDLELFEETSALVHDTVVSIREFCGELRPSTLDYAGLVPALDNFLQQFGRRNNCATQFQHAAFSGQCSVDVASLLFRIAQEALLNCRKHAQASMVQVMLLGTPEHLRLEVTDNGKGFDLAQVGRSGQMAGQGLLNMRERAAFAGGDCTIISSPGHGTTVRVELGASGA
jgi:PAS domain S-box-containing protein